MKRERKPANRKKVAQKKVAQKKTVAKPKRKNPALERENYHLPARSELEQFEGLAPELLEAWQALRRFCLNLGEQKDMNTSHRSIMFYQKTCYLFVRPKKKFVEVNIFLGRAVKHAFIKKTEPVSKTKWVHVLELVHADQVEEPITDWIREAFEFSA